jgi:hypothetical protein
LGKQIELVPVSGLNTARRLAMTLLCGEADKDTYVPLLVAIFEELKKNIRKYHIRRFHLKMETQSSV